MPNNTTTITGIEQGRAKFAYECAKEGQTISKGICLYREINYKQDDKYASHIQKIPMLVKTNGMGATIAFIFSKRETKTKEVNGKKFPPGTKDNPQNAYDLIYQQMIAWLAKEPKHLIADKLASHNGKRNEFVDVLVTLESPLYRAVTVEVLSFFTWLKRFAEGLIEGESKE